MAAYTLHYILFSVTKIANTHLLLNESFQAIWPAPEPSRQQEQLRQLYSHTMIFVASIASFLGALKTLKSVDKSRRHRRCMLDALAVSFLCHLAYLYTINTLATGRTSAAPLCLRAAHTAIVVALMTGLQWAQTTIGSLGDSLTVNFCLRSSKPARAHYQFVTHLMIGSLSLACTSVSLCEMLMASGAPAGLSYSNTALALGLLASGAEILVFRWLTGLPASNVLLGVKAPRHSPSLLARVALSMDGDELSKSKPVYSLRHNPDRSLSDSIRFMSKQGETLHNVDEDECENTVELFYISEPSQKSGMPALGASIFDRSKFELYDNYRANIRAQYKLGIIHPAGPLQAGKPAARKDGQERRRGTFEILFVEARDSGAFLSHFLLLVVVGSVHQANQLCFFTDYLQYLLEGSPAEFREAMSAALWPVLARSHLPAKLTHLSTWLVLTCAAFLAQSSAKIVCLHHANWLVFKLGTKRSLLSLLTLALVVPLQFVLNQQLVERPQLLGAAQAGLVLGQLVFIQAQVGVISALADFLINDLTLQHAQQVANYQSSQAAATASSSVQCTVHALLSGSFYSMGSALAAALFLAIIGTLNRLQPSRAYLTSLPAIGLLSLLLALCVVRLKLKRNQPS